MALKLIISAGGKNIRMRDFLDRYFNGIPKHLLPLPNKKTIIEEIIDNAKNFFDEIVISVNHETYPIFRKKLGDLEKITIEIDTHLTGPLGPICRELLKTKKRIYGCAGDFFCNFSWKEFEDFHNSHKKPISILVAPSLSIADGACFTLKDKIITSWKRVEETADFDIINIGAYIIDPHPLVVKKVSKIKYHKEDIFFNVFIPTKSVCGYNPNIIGFNINTPETYKKLCAWFRNQNHA